MNTNTVVALGVLLVVAFVAYRLLSEPEPGKTTTVPNTTPQNVPAKSGLTGTLNFAALGL